ncbi:MAG TPA: hypothetical protein VL251_09915 [Thermomonas sp.]|nr:hypothetical protein [Thermomonas sp.]
MPLSLNEIREQRYQALTSLLPMAKPCKAKRRAVAATDRPTTS